MNKFIIEISETPIKNRNTVFVETTSKAFANEFLELLPAGAAYNNAIQELCNGNILSPFAITQSAKIIDGVPINSIIEIDDYNRVTFYKDGKFMKLAEFINYANIYKYQHTAGHFIGGIFGHKNNSMYATNPKSENDAKHGFIIEVSKIFKRPITTRNQDFIDEIDAYCTGTYTELPLTSKDYKTAIEQLRDNNFLNPFTISRPTSIINGLFPNISIKIDEDVRNNYVNFFAIDEGYPIEILSEFITTTIRFNARYFIGNIVVYERGKLIIS